VAEWLEPKAIDVTKELLSSAGGHSFVAGLLAQRGITDPRTACAFLDPDCYTPSPATEFPEMERAVERVEAAIEKNERICVWGDFDVDGQTSTALLISVLGALGGNVIYHVPHRHREGHGMRPEVLDGILNQGIGLVVTCDTGTTAHEALALASSRGVDVIVTDHHVPSEQRPPVYALVNPRLLPSGHPLGELPGVGVAYKLAESLCERSGQEPLAASQLDLVALGIVSDVAVHAGDVRYLLQKGLEVIRAGDRLGLRTIIEAAGLSQEDVSEEHIGFSIAPRLNSLGRLADASEGVELLTTNDTVRARILAAQLEGLNVRRQLLTKQVFDGARSQVERDPSLLEYAALVLSHPSWPGGVVGIVAGRLAEYYGRPVVLISAPPGEVARGSARSVAGCDINAAIGANGHMLYSYGGHPMAAGLSMDPERIAEFRNALGRTVAEQCGTELAEESLQIDAWINLADLSLELIGQVNRLAPFGPGNPTVRLATRDVHIVNHSLIGKTREHRRLLVVDASGLEQTVLWWQGGIWSVPQGTFDLAYTVRATDFQGKRQVQVEWLDARTREAPLIVVTTERPKIEIVDCRGDRAPARRLQELRAEGDLLVWAEGLKKGEQPGVDRRNLSLTPRLAIWTLPPGPEELREVMEKTSPSIVYFFGMGTGLDRPSAFLKRLAGLVKYALRELGGQLQLSTVAALLGHRVVTVRKGIEWLVAKGQVRLVAESEDAIILMRDSGEVRSDLGVVQAQLAALLEETAAYRDYYRSADKEHLL